LEADFRNVAGAEQRHLQQPVKRSFVSDLVRFNRFGALATHVVIHNGREEVNVNKAAIDHMSFFGHYLNEASCIATMRTR
jgi:hypothetical protein